MRIAAVPTAVAAVAQETANAVDRESLTHPLRNVRSRMNAAHAVPSKVKVARRGAIADASHPSFAAWWMNRAAMDVDAKAVRRQDNAVRSS